ncbi:adenosine deaminase-like [Lytechinus variegatus]|uniref:adenosine deaminase-like n=1 Tax=Lytechinus variegatus TaxID=7654 RepID=UPI001BB1BD7D|nr:adenosine deaminase-like [Lytechinus variegatus]
MQEAVLTCFNGRSISHSICVFPIPCANTHTHTHPPLCTHSAGSILTLRRLLIMAGGINFRVIMSPLSAAGICYRREGSVRNIMDHICRRHHGTNSRRDAGTDSSSLRTFPKVQLHIHLDGAVRHDTLWRAARKKGLCGPANTFHEFVDLVRCSKGDLVSFLSSFDTILPIIAGDRELISQIAYELCEDQANEGVVYFEARYCPHYMSSSFSTPSSRKNSVVKDDYLTPRDVVMAVNDGMRRGCRQFNVKGRTLLCLIRPCPEFSHEMVELSHEFLNDTVVGIDMAGDEDAPCTKEHIDAFKLAADLGLHRTVHAGELGPAENVRFAVEELGAERIGHGYQIYQDLDVYKMIRDRFVHLELCPTSSIYTGACKGRLSDHIAKRFEKDGFNIGINTDDPTLLSNTMESEFELAKRYFDFNDGQLKNMTMNAARASFLPESEKTHLIQELQTKFDAL